MKMKKPAARKVAKKTMAAKKPVRKMETGGMSGDPVKPKVQTTKAVTVSNKPKKKGPVAKMGEMETRLRSSMIKLRETGFGFRKEDRTPHEQRILNKDLDLYKKRSQAEKLEKMKQTGTQFENKRKVAKLQKEGYSQQGFKKGGKMTARKKK